MVSNKLNFDVVDQKSDIDQNFIALKIKIEGVSVIFGSVYGPNAIDRRFFTELERAINQLRGGEPIPIIMGGDCDNCYCLGITDQ